MFVLFDLRLKQGILIDCLLGEFDLADEPLLYLLRHIVCRYFSIQEVQESGHALQVHAVVLMDQVLKPDLFLMNKYIVELVFEF